MLCPKVSLKPMVFAHFGFYRSKSVFKTNGFKDIVGQTIAISLVPVNVGPGALRAFSWDSPGYCWDSPGTLLGPVSYTHLPLPTILLV